MFGRPEASEEEMIMAATYAEAHEFILSLRDSVGRRGYDAHVGERGVTLQVVSASVLPLLECYSKMHRS